MHYKSGQEAKIGDIVKGEGYNVKDVDGHPLPIVGVVVGLTPGTEACNLQVAYLRHVQLPRDFVPPSHLLFHAKGVIGPGVCGAEEQRHAAAMIDHEYGQCDEFELVQRG